VKKVLPIVAIAAGLAVIFVLGHRNSSPAVPAGRSDAPASKARNVLLITLDTMRADRIGAYGYAGARTPNLDALAQNGIRFDDATAPAPITGPAHAAILTGMLPGRVGVIDNVTTPLPESAVTLGEILAQRQFATAGFVGAFILDRPYGFAQGFATFESGFTRVDSGNEANAERAADAVVSDASRWLASLPADRPFFAWVHLYDAHVGYHPPQPFSQDYDGEIAFVDQQIGRLLTAIRARSAAADTLVVAVGDHGESLGEHGEDEHGIFLYDAVLRVPLIASGAGIATPRVVSTQVRAIDVAPTILDLLGIPAPENIDGISLRPAMEGRTPADPPSSYSESHYPKLHYGWSELRAVRADGWKAIDAPKPELYNLRDDPREQTNLYASQAALAQKMLAEAASRASEFAGTAQPPRQPDRETLERLRSLGYVGATAPARGATRGPDPKDRIAERREYNTLMADAIDALRGGRADAAAAQFKRLIQMNDRAYDLHQFLGEAYDRLGQPRQALGEYEYAALLNPESVTPLVAAAEVHLRHNDISAARRKLAEASRLEPQAYEVLVLTGHVFEREQRAEEALAAYERAVQQNPANPHARTRIVAISTQVGRWDVADRELRKLLEMGYQPARTFFALGRVAQAQGRNADAAANYREALRLEPGLRMAEEGLRSLGVK
jgi:arylsulfatase A-like enzyme/Tfp pilus assembly protein PilF